MYVFYADESGFPKSAKYEPEQPVLVTAGILVNSNGLSKAINEFDRILMHVNSRLSRPVNELKFAEIRNHRRYRFDVPVMQDRADLLTKIVRDFKDAVEFKIIYCAIDSQEYARNKKAEEILNKQLKHPYLSGTYGMLNTLNEYQSNELNDNGKTIVVLDEQDMYQRTIEQLIKEPIHGKLFNQILDTSYFGKSHYSKLIQMADLIAGIFRYYLMRRKQGKEDDHWVPRLCQIIEMLRDDIVQGQDFDSPLKEVYHKIEIKI